MSTFFIVLGSILLVGLVAIGCIVLGMWVVVNYLRDGFWRDLTHGCEKR